ncbi:response regulator [Phragmitibacter flavus]|uniref:histidine kinase n=1 Tax=Phragmitibacter flavus TaxID=2576071 RepID=A0A5R8KIY5_9BACT|nr:ATP-binding protein [Phragmitibacter flavus]TLD72274.1 response regulator [Phragmitibacter flavus]
MAAVSSLTCDPPRPRQASTPGQADPLKAAHLASFYLRTALDQSTEGVMILQPAHDEVVGPKVIFSNSRMAMLSGADPRSGMRGTLLKDLLPGDAEYADLLEALHQADRQGGAGQWVGDLRTCYGQRTQRCHWRIRAVQNDFGRLQNYTLTVTPAKPEPTATAALQSSSNNEAQDARRMRNDNLATMSQGVLHDLNNLLGIIMTNLSAVSQWGEGNEQAAHHVQEALDAAAQAREFTTQTLRMAKDVPATREPLELAQIVREATRIAQSGSGVKLHMHVPKDLWWTVADRSSLAQVVQNLVINGIQAMNNSGSMDVGARNVMVPQGHSLLQPGPYVEVLVRDRGCGMPPDLLTRVMHEPFTTKAQGNGIGLTTCRRVIEEHGGKMHISSMSGIGTEVHFWLPASNPLLAPVETIQEKNELIRGTGSVLVVDDEDRLRQVIVTVLKQCGYRVYEAPGGSEAVDLYRNLMRQGQEIDLVIMDLTLKGGLSGEESMRGIRSLNTSAKVIASSGGLVEETREHYLQLGFCDILPKPYLAPDVAALVHHHILQIHHAAPQSQSRAA